jgi:hypothetical protein
MTEHHKNQLENLHSKNVPIYTQLRDLGIGRVYVITAPMTKAKAPYDDILGRLEQLRETPEKIMDISMVADETPIILPVTDENDPNLQHIMFFPNGYVLLFQPKNQAAKAEYLKYFSINSPNDFLFEKIIDKTTGKLVSKYLDIVKQGAMIFAEATYFDPKESDENKRIVLSAVDKAIENAKKIVEEQRRREKEFLEAVRNKSLDI